MTQTTFDEFVASLAPLDASDPAESKRELEIRAATNALEALDVVDADSLAELIREKPEWFPVLGLVVGLSQEGLKRQLAYRTGSDAWISRAKQDPAALIAVLDTEEFKLIEQLDAQRLVTYTLGDVLVARAGTRGRAVKATSTGRILEDLVEDLIKRVRLPYQPRTRFEGAGGRDAPCDFAIPQGGASAQIVVAVKGYGSTGSKVTTSVDEIRIMSQVRRPTQFVFAVCDGIGWLGRKADLRRIFTMASGGEIDGLYSLATFTEFEEDLLAAARRLGLLAP